MGEMEAKEISDIHYDLARLTCEVGAAVLNKPVWVYTGGRRSSEGSEMV